MADIKQAAKWMQEGKTVRRMDWADTNPKLRITAIPVEVVYDIPESGYGSGRDCVVVNANRQEFSMLFSTQALLADDWEIAE